MDKALKNDIKEIASVLSGFDKTSLMLVKNTVNVLEARQVLDKKEEKKVG